VAYGTDPSNGDLLLVNYSGSIKRLIYSTNLVGTAAATYACGHRRVCRPKDADSAGRNRSLQSQRAVLVG